MDFKIENGELVLDNSILKTVEEEEFNVQLALSYIQSVARDWFYDHIGCDLEYFIGKNMNETNISTLKSSISGKLSENNLFDEDDISIIYERIENECITLTVYLKSYEHENDFYKIQVEIELAGKVYAKLGDELVCLY